MQSAAPQTAVVIIGEAANITPETWAKFQEICPKTEGKWFTAYWGDGPDEVAA